MLKYIWMVIQDLFVTVTLVSLIHAEIRIRFGKNCLRISREWFPRLFWRL